MTAASGPGRPASSLSAQFNGEIESQLFQAQSAEIGLCIRTNDVAEYLRRAYIVKRKAAAQAPELEGLTFKRSPLEANRVWIIRTEALRQPAEEPTANEEAQRAE